MKQVLLSFLFLTACVLLAETAENIFVNVTSTSSRIDATPEGDFHLEESDEITISAKEDWILIRPRLDLLRVKSGSPVSYAVQSRMGEDSSTGTVEVCSFPKTRLRSHRTNPEVYAEFSNLEKHYIYSGETCTNLSFILHAEQTRSGTDEILTQWEPCETCGKEKNPSEELSLAETRFSNYFWEYTLGALSGSTNAAHCSVALSDVPSGTYTLNAALRAETDECEACSATTNLTQEVSVHKLTSSVPLFLGLNRTDAYATSNETVKACATLTPEWEDAKEEMPDCTWSLEEGSALVLPPETNAWEIVLSAKDKESASKTLDGEKISATVNGVTAVTNCTVVKVDVSIDSIPEEKEETVGAFIPYASDDNGVLTENGTNTLVNVTFSFEPSQVPTSEKVKISYTGTAGELYLCENGTLTKITEQEFPANGISNMVFKLHGHTPSTENEKDTITITHLGSGATDQIAIHYTTVNLVGYATGNGLEVPEAEEVSPGFLVVTKEVNIPPAVLTFEGIQGFPESAKRFFRVSKTQHLRFDNTVIATSDYIEIEGVDSVSYNVTMTDTDFQWADGTHFVDVEYVVKDGDKILGSDTCRLLRPYIVAIGDSLTYGLQRARINGTANFLTPRWDRPWASYPTAETWAALNPPYNVPENRKQKEYQGYRGYLADALPGFTWLGRDTNRHGPSHCGRPGAIISEINADSSFYNQFLAQSPSYLIVLYFSGMNNCSGSDIGDGTSIFIEWKNGLEHIKTSRHGRGRTLLCVLKIPQLGDEYINFVLQDGNKENRLQTARKNITTFNSLLSQVEGDDAVNFIKTHVIDTSDITHINDDGQHFNHIGYQEIANILFATIKNVL